MFYKVITTTGIAVTVAVFVLAVQTPNPRGDSDGIVIPLTKHSGTDAPKFHAISKNAKIIHGPSGMDNSERNTGTPFAVKRADEWGDSIDLTKYMDGIWYGTISIGTPPKSFTVHLSTGSSDLVVPTSTGNQNCRSHSNLWDPATSSEITNWPLDEDFAIVFADGRLVRGKQYLDNVTIAGYTADIQTIGAATTYSSTMAASEFPPDGILGLGFPSLSDFHGQSPLFHTLYTEGKLSQPVFSLMLTASGGELYVGGMNEALYIHNTLVYTPVTNPNLWQLKIDNIKVNNKIVLRDVPAIIDTGANFIYGDSQGVLALHQAVGGGGLYPGGSDYYTFPCMSFPYVTFTIRGKPFRIPARVLNKGRVAPTSQDCFSGIMTLDKDFDPWSIGTIFLEQFYTVFDFDSESPRVGFARLAGTP